MHTINIKIFYFGEDREVNSKCEKLILLFFFMKKNKANERSGRLMVSDYRRPRPRATPEELQVRYRHLRWVGRRSPALPDAKGRHKATTSR